LAVGGSVGVLLAWHLYLVLSGQSTVEFYHNSQRARMARAAGETYRNEYDLGSARNWRMFFGGGGHWLAWALPFTRPTGDGLKYLTRQDLIAGMNGAIA
jgi:palmitoyltransferase